MKLYLNQWPALPINWSVPNPCTHGGMCWWSASRGSYPKVMVRSCQGHSKAKPAQNGWKYLWFYFFAKIMFTWVSMMARSISEPKQGYMSKHPKRLQGLYKDSRVFYSPWNHPRVTPVWYGRNGPNNPLMLCFDQWPVYNNCICINPSTHVKMSWGWISQGCHPKVMVRSSQGHIKVKLAQNEWN